MVLKFNVPPKSTIEYASKSLSENLEPLAYIFLFPKVFPTIIPKNIAKDAPPIAGIYIPINLPV
ncbi:hypothetical protein SDC9_192851 [bioreactor metagenome]|uniref:Uncharacterized protein n=1 Tax=bioreactor metagenome TaxID=1076179 RepID=A0A645IAD1_9ZZZZ